MSTQRRLTVEKVTATPSSARSAIGFGPYICTVQGRCHACSDQSTSIMQAMVSYLLHPPPLAIAILRSTAAATRANATIVPPMSSDCAQPLGLLICLSLLSPRSLPLAAAAPY